LARLDLVGDWKDGRREGFVASDTLDCDAPALTPKALLLFLRFGGEFIIAMLVFIQTRAELAAHKQRCLQCLHL
jgi:hypothetical protein